eukprot:scaffold624_cov402-Prasinococcus_capsulatus_cf.AAC.26
MVARRLDDAAPRRGGARPRDALEPCNPRAAAHDRGRRGLAAGGLRSGGLPLALGTYVLQQQLPLEQTELPEACVTGEAGADEWGRRP